MAKPLITSSTGEHIDPAVNGSHSGNVLIANRPRVLVDVDHLVAAALFVLLYAIYWLTASFTFISTDELFLFDATESFARRGSLLRNETADLDWPGHSQVEPALPLLSVPLFWLADQIDGVGNVHVTLHFNLLVTAATAVVLFYYVRRLNYDRPTAALTTALFGFTTIAWPYSENYFREPLATLTLFLAAYALLAWRQALAAARAWPHRWLALAVAAASISIFTKESGAVGVPILLLIPAVDSRWLRWNRRDWLRICLVVFVLGGLALVGGKYYTGVLGGATARFDPLGRAASAVSNFGLAQTGVVGFLFSPGKSIFIYSPILLLAFAGPWLARRRRPAATHLTFDVFWPLLLAAVFIVVYALVRAEIWFGGTNWGPRYLVPLTPFLMISVAPAIARALRGAQRWRWRALVLGLAGLGLFVQIGAVAVNPLDYYEVLAQTGIAGAAWTVALWTPYYSAVLGHWRLLGREALDFAWQQALPAGPAWAVAAAFAVLASLALLLLLRFTKRDASRPTATLSMGLLALALVATTGFGARRIYPDQRFRGGETALHDLRNRLQELGAADAVVFLNNRTYFNFFMNYYKGDIVWYTLQLNPKELIPEGETRPPYDADPIDFLNTEAWSRVDYFARQYETAFLVMEAGPFHPTYVRPMEWWMNTEFHRLFTEEFADNVRLVQFSSASAPDRADPAEYDVDYVLGERIALTGFDPNPPAGLVEPGTVLNVSTQWRALQDVTADYVIGTYLITPQGTLALQNDSVPAGGFWPTYTWRAGDVIRHNVALKLPDDIPPGHYEVWTLMYSFFDGARLPVEDSSGTTIRDHVVLYSVEITR